MIYNNSSNDNKNDENNKLSGNGQDVKFQDRVNVIYLCWGGVTMKDIRKLSSIIPKAPQIDFGSTKKCQRHVKHIARSPVKSDV